MNRTTLLIAFVLTSSCFAALAQAEVKPREILIHEGPVFTTPGLGPNEEIEFTKEFPVDAETLKKQPELGLADKLPLSAGKAIELAKDSADAGDPPGEKNLVRMTLHPFKRDQDGITLYYFIELNVDGNEIHRVVLMDGTVVKSRLRQLSGK